MVGGGFNEPVDFLRCDKAIERPDATVAKLCCHFKNDKSKQGDAVQRMKDNGYKNYSVAL